MIRTKSSKKALRQSKKRNKQNNLRKDLLKKAIKNFQKSVKTGKFEDAKKNLSQVFKFADKVAKVDTIKKGKADRIKSRMSQLLTKSLRKK